VTKADWQYLADLRLSEAELLLSNMKLDGAYYLGGLSVECALKACILKRLSNYWPEKDFYKEMWAHDLSKLLDLADLNSIHKDAKVSANWGIVKDWKVDTRYEYNHSSRPEPTIRQFLKAIDDPTDGVMQWLQKQW
jgi:hypothetical protein